MAERIFSVFRTTDREVFEKLAAIGDKVTPNGNHTFIFRLADQYRDVNAARNQVDSQDVVKEIFAQNAAVCRAIECHISANAGAVMLLVERSDPHDNARLRFPEQTDQTTIARILAGIQEHLPVYGRMAQIERLLGEELAEFYRKREEGLLRLEGIAERLITDTDQYRRTLDAQVDAQRQRVEKDLETERERLAKEYARKEAAVTQREEEVQRQLKELDDRSSRHARRQLRTDLKNELKERSKAFALTKQTGRKRWVIHAAFVVLIGLTGYLFVRAFGDQLVLQSDVPKWYVVVRLAFAGLAAAAAIVFYIRWNDDWFRQHAKEEFRLRRLDLDIDRASWIVEMAQEWRDEKGGEIPPELIETLARNLFQESESTVVRHPTEHALATLLGASSKLTLRVPGGEAELDRKALKDLEKRTGSD